MKILSNSNTNLNVVAKSGATSLAEIAAAAAVAVAQERGAAAPSQAPTITSADSTSLETRAKSGSYEQDVQDRIALMLKEQPLTDMVIGQTTDAAKVAAKITAGTVAINKIVAMAKPKMPMMVRGYIEEPVGKIVVANALAVALKKFKGNDAKALYLAEALLEASALMMAQSFDIEGMLGGLLDGVTVPEAEPQA